MDEERAAQVHLAEYNMLRTEIGQYSQRIDRIVGVYLTALVALAGYLLRPEADVNVTDYVTVTRDSEGRSGVWLLLSIVNMTILIRLISFFGAVIAMSQHADQVLRPALTRIAAEEVLLWDSPARSHVKRTWLHLRNLAQGIFLALSTAFSLGILIVLNPAHLTSTLNISLFLVTILVFALMIYCLVRITLAGLNFHEAD